jgi:hypothetical protein
MMLFESPAPTTFDHARAESRSHDDELEDVTPLA